MLNVLPLRCRLLLAVLFAVSFHAAAQPKITSFSPASGPIGTSVTITGSGFNTVASSNIVYFGAVRATVTGSSATTITVTAPAGTTYQPVSVLNTATGLMAHADRPFVTTFFNPAGTVTPDYYQPGATFSMSDLPYVLILSDLDIDGKPDLIAPGLVSATALLRNTATTGNNTSSPFASKVYIDAGPNPYDAVASDIDGDGKPDLVTCTNSDNAVSVLHNISAPGSLTGSSFEPKISFTADHPTFLEVKDVDLDGKPDVIAANNTVFSGMYATRITILRNTSGRGVINATSFAAGVTIPVNYDFSTLNIADLDGDGKQDIIYASGGVVYCMRNISVAGSISTGSFAPQAAIANISGYIKISDVDGDGKPDILRYTSDMLSVLRNTFTSGNINTTSFAPPVNFPFTSGIRIYLDDVDGDGKPDILAAGSNKFSVMRNTAVAGSITSSSFAPPLSFVTGINSGSGLMVIGDVNADGFPEVMIANGSNSTATVFYISASQPPPPVSPVITSLSPASGQAGNTVTITGTDFNATPAGNIVYFGAVRATVTGASSTSLTVTVPAGATYQPVSVLNTATGLSGYSSKPFAITFTNPFGTALPAGFYRPKVDFGTDDTPSAVAIADLDNDGKPDLVTSANGAVSILRNTSTTGSISATSFSNKVSIAATGFNIAVATGDLDGDGKQDIVFTEGSSNTLAVLLNISTPGTLGASSFSAPVRFAINNYSPSIAIADMDGDGKADIVITNGNSQSVGILRNVSTTGTFNTSSFAPAVNFSVPTGASALSVGDLDNDGKPDIAVSANDAVAVLHNISMRGTINLNSFAGAVIYGTGGSSGHISIADVDGDGKPDLVSASYSTNFISVLRNTTSNGTINASSFAANVDFPLGSQPVFVTTGDADGDGKPDIITAYSNTHTVYVLHNTAVSGTVNTSSFASPVGFATGADIVSATLGDLDGDGITELVTANQSGNSVSVLNISSPAVTPAPVVSSFSPVSGAAGSVVTITGYNFNSVAANNTVYFGTVKATVISGTSGSLAVTVPTGTTYQPVSVLNTANGLTGYSPNSFLTTFANPYGPGVPPGYYLPKSDFGTGTLPYTAAIGDLDGDGKPDMAVVNFNQNTVSVLRNTSTPGSVAGATFAAKVDFPTGVNPFSVSIGDVDGDGKPDLVVTNYTAGSVSVLRNTSASGTITSASFAGKIDFSTGDLSYPFHAAIGDIDGDGKPEIVSANSHNNTMSVLHNNKVTGMVTTASFSEKTEFATGDYPRFVAIRDLDGDGKADVVIANEHSNSVSVFRNITTTGSIGTSSFEAPTQFITGEDPVCIATGDLDGDGKPDIATSNFRSENVSVLRNYSSAGNLAGNAFSDMSIIPTSSGAYYLAIADADGDGRPDLLTANSESNTMSVFQNPLTPYFFTVNAFLRTDFPANGYPVCVASGDLDGDGRPEVITTNAASNTISIFTMKPFSIPVITSLNPSSGPVSTAVTITGLGFNPVPAGNIVYFGAVRATVTGGSATGITVTAPAGATHQPVSVLNTAFGLTGYAAKPFISTFTNPFGSGIPANYYRPKVDFTTGTLPYFTAIGDLDGDGKPDIVTANKTANTISILRNVSATGNINAGSFAAKVDLPTGVQPLGVAIGDVDGDGKPDIVVVNSTSSTLSFFRNTSISGSITASSFAPKLDITTANYPFSVTISDLDKDGKPELIVAYPSLGRFSVLQNLSATGNITVFSFRRYDYFTNGSTRYIVASDVDGDGKPDLAMIDERNGNVSVWKNRTTIGNITLQSFYPDASFVVGYNPGSIAVSDVDNDGKPDLIVSNFGSNTVSVLRNTAVPGPITSAAFAPAVNFATGPQPFFVAAGDADGDGKPDLLVANAGSGTMSVLRNTSVPGTITASSFAGMVSFGTGGYPVCVALGDLDGDGVAEAVTANAASNSISILKVNSASPFAAEATAKETNILMSEDGTAGKIQVYPNPASGIFTLQLSGLKAGGVSIDILDETGKVIQKRSLTLADKTTGMNMKLSLTGQPAGVYYVKVTGVEGVQVMKIVLQR